MDDLMQNWEEFEIRDKCNSDSCKFADLQLYIDLIQENFVPQRTVGIQRPLEEKDFKEFKLVLEKNLHRLKPITEHLIGCEYYMDNDGGLNFFLINLLLLIGEHDKKNVWNTDECISVCNTLHCYFKDITGGDIEQFLSFFLSDCLLILRPKILKDTWKTYPAAVACYIWLLKWYPSCCQYLEEVLSIGLIILDDYFPDNVLIGLECIYLVMKYSYMETRKINTSYTEVIYHALERFTHQKEVKYVMPLYNNMAYLLTTMEDSDKTVNLFEWTRRDDVLMTLINNMEFEQNIELRHAYMSSLPRLITSVGSSKWCEALIRVLVEYCEHHTDLRTLRETLLTAKVFIAMCRMRVAAHCIPLYTTFMKLHLDLSKTPVFDQVIIDYLEDCINMLNHLLPNVAHTMQNDDRVPSVFNHRPMLTIWDGTIIYFQ